MGATYRIAEVAARSGFTPAALRYYEDIGLVRPVERTDAGYRLYDDSSLQRLRFIARTKQLGCSLQEIAELAAAWDAGRCAPVQERLRAAVEVKISESQRQVAELSLLAAELQRTAAALATTPPTGPCDDTCGCLTASPPADSPVAASAGPDGPGSEGSGSATPAGWAASGDGGCGHGGCGCDASGGEPAVACSLEPGQLGGRFEEWSALLSGVVDRVALDGGVRLVLGPDADVGEAARLAAAEQECCRFFRFALSIDSRGVALEVRAPAEAADVVVALFGTPA